VGAKDAGCGVCKPRSRGRLAGLRKAGNQGSASQDRIEEKVGESQNREGDHYSSGSSREGRRGNWVIETITGCKGVTNLNHFDKRGKVSSCKKRSGRNQQLRRRKRRDRKKGEEVRPYE